MKEKAWKNVIAVLIIALALMAGGINVSAASGITIRQGKVYQNNKVYTGWFSQNNGKYYSVKGIRAKGWKKISNKFYVDKTGVRVTTKEIRQAVAFVMRYSKATDLPSKRLRTCFCTLLNYPYYNMTDHAPRANQIASCAGYMFTYRRGDCYYYASTMAYIARVLGYDARVACGAVTAREPYAALSPHGWCEVKYGNAWKMLSPEM